jgi:hypothetical protein
MRLAFLVVGFLVMSCAQKSEQHPSKLAASVQVPPTSNRAIRCLPVIADKCGCVYDCGVGTEASPGEYEVIHPFWGATKLTARVDRWCVDGKCTDAFFADIVCGGICVPKPARTDCACR